ncbi:MAG: MATE family efflux transporter [Christensenella sp.]|uniref:MATE family efflux transporter n=1 Tax=Christensenella sp. TaxID=1935934 RepID=UPI002B1F6EC0|nr:MATE family efflux transporter [Christensenella sp.]MEA5003241.1 MATE family efflux transporter [Christensenella sp.]
MQSISNENITATFFKYVSLNVLSMFGLSLYVLADTFFVANGVGPSGLVALNLAIPVYSFINGLGLMIGIGSATLFSIAIGKGKRDSLNRIFTQAFVVALVCGVVITVCGLLFNRPFAIALGAEGEHIIEMTSTYLKMLMLFSCAFILNNLLVAFVRNDGDPRLAMIGMLSGCLFNIVFDYIFVFPMQLGIFGAALATGVSPIVSMAILSLHFLRKKNSFKLQKTKFKGAEIRKTIFTGLPSFVMEASSGIIIIVFNLTILRIAGDLGVAAYGIIANLALVCIAIFTGIGQGIQPILSHSYGAGRMDHVRHIYTGGAIIAVVLGLVFFLIGLFFPSQIASIFNNENNAQLAALTVDGLRIYFFGFVFAGLNIVTTSFFASIAKPRPSFAISALRGFGLIIPFVLLLPNFFGLNGVWMAGPATEILTLVCALLLVLHFFRKHHAPKTISAA